MTRVYLTELAATDQDEFVAAMQASEALHRPWLYAADTPAAFQMLVQRTRGAGFVSLLARHKDTGALLGFFNISNIIRANFQSAYIGYGAVAGQMGQGYMTEAMELVLHHAFGALRLHRLEANIQPQNLPSIALVKRCGFVKEGVSERYLKIGGRWRDHERWAIRAEQWREHVRTRGT